MTRTRRLAVFGVPIFLLMTLATLSHSPGGLMARAQGDGDTPHPAHIHSGSCDNLGDIVAPLTDVTEATAGEVFGSDAAVPVKESETDVELSLNDILAAPHAINIHESADAIQVYIACGDIGGRVVGGNLLIGLQEIDGSGHNGVALLETGDDGTGVTAYLAEQGAAGETEQAAADTDADATAPADAAATVDTPEAAATQAPAAKETAEPAAAETEEPAADAAAGQEVPVDIRDFAFSPNPIEIAVGDTVTWTNQDAVPHTATAEDRGVLQSGTISPGASFSQDFAQAGEFPYFCEFHPNMTGTIVVQ